MHWTTLEKILKYPSPPDYCRFLQAAFHALPKPNVLSIVMVISKFKSLIILSHQNIPEEKSGHAGTAILSVSSIAGVEQIIVHVQFEPGKFQTLQQHIHSQKRSKIEKGTVWLLRKASLIGTNADKWAQAVLEARGIPGIEVMRDKVNSRFGQNISLACGNTAYQILIAS